MHITCNMGSRDLPDMYALSPQACGFQALGTHIRKIPPAHVTTYNYKLVIEKWFGTVSICIPPL